jgi:hypothetical protein
MLAVTRVLAIFTSLGLLAAGARLAAQAEPATPTAPAALTEAETLLAAAKVLTCTFPVSVRTTWKAGVPTPAVRRTGRLVVEYRDMKPEQGSAALETPRAPKDVTMVVNPKGRSFLDAGGGKVALTTVLGEFSTGTRLKAVHSISDFTLLEIASFRSEPDVIQHMGDCEATQ